MSNNPKEISPRERWAQLMAEVVARIDGIDKDTPFTNVEPDWWMEMMEVHSFIRARQPRKVDTTPKAKLVDSMPLSEGQPSGDTVVQ